MLNLVSESCECALNVVFYYLYTSSQVLVVLSLTIKFGLLSEAIDFTYSNLDYPQSGF